jgi:hypothetical protein
MLFEDKAASRAKEPGGRAIATEEPLYFRTSQPQSPAELAAEMGSESSATGESKVAARVRREPSKTEALAGSGDGSGSSLRWGDMIA